MSIASAVFQWWRPAARAARTTSQVERFPTHSRVVLPDGQIMHVRVASLAAAKDLLAAQRAAERRITAHRESQVISEVAQIVNQSRLLPGSGREM